MAASATAMVDGNSPAMSTITKRRCINTRLFGEWLDLKPLSQRERGAVREISPLDHDRLPAP